MGNSTRNHERESLIQAGVNNSPFYKHLGMRLTGFTDQGSEFEMQVLPEHKNLWGIMHGGAVSSLVDSVCGTAVGQVLEEGETVVTLDLRVQFFSPIREGKVTAKGSVAQRSKRYATADAEVFDAQGKLMARGTTIHAIILG